MMHFIHHGEQLLKQSRSRRRFWILYTLVVGALSIAYLVTGMEPWLLGGLTVLGAYMILVSHRNVQDRRRFLAGMRTIQAQQRERWSK